MIVHSERGHYMFAKVFEQIFDSSIAENYQVRLVFEDMLTLSDPDGVVDMTPEALARRTNVPLDIIKKAITVLEAPDNRSRRKQQGGRRIIRLDEHRDWGWLIVNYGYYRKLASEEQRRAKTRARVKRFREENRPTVTQCNASVTQLKRNEIKGNDSPSSSSYTLKRESAERERQKKKTPPKYAVWEDFALHLPTCLRTPAMKEMLERWIADRTDRNKRVTKMAAQLQAEKIKDLAESDALEAIRTAIDSGWQSFFPKPRRIKRGENTKREFNLADLEALEFYEEQIRLLQSTRNEAGIPELYKKIRDNYGAEGIDFIKQQLKEKTKKAK